MYADNTYMYSTLTRGMRNTVVILYVSTISRLSIVLSISTMTQIFNMYYYYFLKVIYFS